MYTVFSKEIPRNNRLSCVLHFFWHHLVSLKFDLSETSCFVDFVTNEKRFIVTVSVYKKQNDWKILNVQIIPNINMERKNYNFFSFDLKIGCKNSTNHLFLYFSRSFKVHSETYDWYNSRCHKNLLSTLHTLSALPTREVSVILIQCAHAKFGHHCRPAASAPICVRLS